jgi:hypothetical protein
MAESASIPEKLLPPDFAPIVEVWRRMGVCYVVLGIGILLFGCSLLVYEMIVGKSDASAQITKAAGGLVAITSLQLFNMGRQRFERIGFVETLRARWLQLAAKKGAERQLAELNKIVTKILNKNLERAF